MLPVLKMFSVLISILRDLPVYLKATPRLPLQPDLLPERAAGGAPELLLWVQTQEGLQTWRQARTLWLLSRRESLSLLQVRSLLVLLHILKSCMSILWLQRKLSEICWITLCEVTWVSWVWRILIWSIWSSKEVSSPDLYSTLLLLV